MATAIRSTFAPACFRLKSLSVGTFCLEAATAAFCGAVNYRQRAATGGVGVVLLISFLMLTVNPGSTP